MGWRKAVRFPGGSPLLDREQEIGQRNSAGDETAPITPALASPSAGQLRSRAPQPNPATRGRRGAAMSANWRIYWRTAT